MDLGEKTQISRRDFLKLSGAGLSAAALALVGCAPPLSDAEKQAVNQKLVERMKQDLGITGEVKTLANLSETVYKKTYEDMDWMENSTYGTYYGASGQAIEITLDKIGQPLIDVPQGYLPPQEKPIKNNKYIVKDLGRNKLIVYGSSEMLGLLFPSGTEAIIDPMIEQFLREYFAFSKVNNNVFHLDLRPTFEKNQFLNLNEDPDFPKTEQESFQGRIYVKRDKTADSHQPILTNHIFIDVAAVQQSIGLEDLTIEKGLIAALTNEAVNSIANQQLPQEKEVSNEAYSTLAGFASALDPGTARIFLGGNGFQPFIRWILSGIAQSSH